MPLTAVVEERPKAAHAGPKILFQAADVLVLKAAALAFALLLRLVAVGVALTAAVCEARTESLGRIVVPKNRDAFKLFP